MIIGACGFGSTGSSVVTDYLKEYDNISVIDDLEFAWVSLTDGLIDLERAVMRPHNRTTDSITAIRRFRELAERKKHSYEVHGISAETFMKSVDELLEEITQVKWYWYRPGDYRIRSKNFLKAFMLKKVIPRVEKRQGKPGHLWPKEEVSLSVLPEHFYDAARKHVRTLLTAFGADLSKPLALDQPFAGNNPQACFPFFDDPYAVISDRDPRDNYVFSRTKMLGKFHYMPNETVEDFITYYRAIRKDQPYTQANDRILYVRFEDMVYEYDKTTEKLRDFLHLPENPRPKTVFDPALSIANTQVFRRFPQFEEDVRKIEKALPEYLFDFSKYPAPDRNSKMFFGQSPLNNKKKKI